MTVLLKEKSVLQIMAGGREYCTVFVVCHDASALWLCVTAKLQALGAAVMSISNVSVFGKEHIQNRLVTWNTNTITTTITISSKLHPCLLQTSLMHSPFSLPQTLQTWQEFSILKANWDAKCKRARWLLSLSLISANAREMDLILIPLKRPKLEKWT